MLASSISLLKNYFLHAKCDQIGTRPFKHYIIDVHFAAILSFLFFAEFAAVHTKYRMTNDYADTKKYHLCGNVRYLT